MERSDNNLALLDGEEGIMVRELAREKDISGEREDNGAAGAGAHGDCGDGNGGVGGVAEVLGEGDLDCFVCSEGEVWIMGKRREGGA